MDVLLRFAQKVIILMDAKSIIEYLVLISMKTFENQINGYFFCNVSYVVLLMFLCNQNGIVIFKSKLFM